MHRISKINCIIFPLLLSIFVVLTSAEYEILRGTIKDGDIVTNLNWKRRNQILANENLPIWTTQVSSTGPLLNLELQTNLMKEEVGDFALYHDEEKSSAVVYFEKWNSLLGFVDTRYVINDLPIAEINQEHSPDGPYVIKTSKGEYRTDHTKPLDLSICQKPTDQPGPSTSDEYEPPAKRPHTACTSGKKYGTTLYAEVLIFVDFDLIQAEKKKVANYYASLVRKYIVHFNIIDLLIDKLSTDDVKVHLNIAGIVFDAANVLPEPISTNVPDEAFRDVPVLDTYLTFQYMSSYIKRLRKFLPADSFDFYFLSTGKQLQSGDHLVMGRSNLANVFEQRLTKAYYDNLEGSIVRRGELHDYVVAAHEIGHLFGLTHDPAKVGFYNKFMQCYAIMKVGGKFCPDCIKWSDQSIKEFNTYAKENRNHCYLLNFPRSLSPYGFPMRTLSPSAQCLCYGFLPRPTSTRADYSKKVPASSCNKFMSCGIPPHSTEVPIPIDGTPCGENGICWGQRCW